jgi:hypothetical protein
VCEEVLHLFDDKRGTAWLEAAGMRETLDVFLAQPFFADVSPMRRLPLENQTLQKREGYRDILRAWLMLETAAKGVREHVEVVKKVLVLAPEMADELNGSIADGLQRRPGWTALAKVRDWLQT